MHSKLMNSSSSVKQPETRTVFRVLAGILAGFLLLIGLPVVLYAVFINSCDWLWNIFSAICCLYGGIGLAVGARTGRWYDVRA
jgi:hypothetical protein